MCIRDRDRTRQQAPRIGRATKIALWCAVIGLGNAQGEEMQEQHREAAREEWGRTMEGPHSHRSLELRKVAGGTIPRLETQHNGTTGVRIGEAKEPGQEKQS
eukprot:5921149-Heterocapsa_arctica.AAC.1